MACNDYIRMGSGRSLTKQHKMYTENHQNEPPTKDLRTLKGWSTKFGWVHRASLFDADQDGIKTAFHKAKMMEGLGLESERVEVLKKLFTTLNDQIEQGIRDIGQGDKKMDALWLITDKGALKYNGQLVTNMLSVLDDIAKETGGRAKKIDLEVEEIITYYKVVIPGLDGVPQVGDD